MEYSKILLPSLEETKRETPIPDSFNIDFWELLHILWGGFTLFIL